MVEVSPIDVLLDRNLTQWFLEDEVYKGMKICPMLNRQETTAKRADWYGREETAKELFERGLIETPQHSAAGSELHLVRSGEMTGDSERMRMFGYRYIVDNDMMEEHPEAFLQDLEDLAAGISFHLEQAAHSAVRTVAVTKDANLTLNDGNWDVSTKITTDLSDFKAYFSEKNLRGSILDTMFYGSNPLGQLRRYIINKYGEANLRQIGQDISFSDIMHYYLADGQDSETFGWCSSRKPGTVVYRKRKGSYKPAKIQDGEGFRPIINLARLEHDGLTPTTEFQFGVEYAIPITRPEYLFYNNI